MTSMKCDISNDVMINWELSNRTESIYPKDKTLHQLFENQVRENPDSIALIFKDQLLTYSEFYKKVLAVAACIKNESQESNSVVCVCFERSIEMLIGIYGVLFSGNAYLPLDTDWPQKRMESIVSDSASKIILTNSDKINFLNDKCKVIDINEITSTSCSNFSDLGQPTDIAYIIYTSGSTGNPKGVLIEHHSIINRINWMQKKYQLTPKDTLLLKTPYFFDVSVWELFWWFFGGAKLCILEPKFEKFPQALIEVINKNHISKIHFIPSLLSSFLKYLENEITRLESLNIIFCSGEKLDISHLRQFRDTFGNRCASIKLINLYGPTEATVDVTYYHCENNESIIPIGKPIDNTKIFILDNEEIVGNRHLGEICISGVGLARGYLNRIELTNKLFSYNEKLETTIYKTGDIGQWLDDGNIEYIGRSDNQVKIRGVRIELGEIEYAILTYKQVKECIVRVIKKNENIVYMIAYIIPSDGYKKDELNKHLLKILPEYLRPHFYMPMEILPRLANGKINEKELPGLDVITRQK